MEPLNTEDTYICLNRFPPEFKDFLLVNKVPLKFFSDSVFHPKISKRYIRFKPNFNGEDYIKTTLKLENISIENQNFCYEKFEEMINFFAIPETIKLCNLEPYNDAKLYGIDYSSASVVLALNPQPNENILDLCCCPGAKLMFIGDIMSLKNEKIEGSLTGVDINPKRLSICENLCKKYGLDWIKLFECDGTKFQSNILYDKVLVDAECTHDGSIKHLKKYLPEFQINKKKEEKEKNVDEEEKKNGKEKEKEAILSNKEKKRRKLQEELNKNKNIYITQKTKKNEWTMDDFKERVLDPKKLKEIETLQYNLLKNAISLTKPGGLIIYSTCSFIQSQNEEIVLKICQEYKNLELVEIFPLAVKKKLNCSEGFLPKTVRFDPIRSQCGGMFISALQKKL